MIDHNKIDSYFNQDKTLTTASERPEEQRHTRLGRLAKLLLPGLAAVLISLLLIIPSLQQHEYEFKIDITKPQAGEMEKLHMENSIFDITDKDNQVQHFTARNIDETSPGSKLIKLTRPEGTIPAENREWINVKSPVGYFDQNANTLKLQDGVEMFYSEGMNVEVPDLIFDFRKQYGHSQSHVSGQGVFGDIESEGFEYHNKKSLLIFTGKTYIKIRENSFKSRN